MVLPCNFKLSHSCCIYKWGVSFHLGLDICNGEIPMWHSHPIYFLHDWCCNTGTSTVCFIWPVLNFFITKWLTPYKYSFLTTKRKITGHWFRPTGHWFSPTGEVFREFSPSPNYGWYIRYVLRYLGNCMRVQGYEKVQSFLGFHWRIMWSRKKQT